MYGHRARSAPARQANSTGSLPAYHDDLFPLSKLVAGPSRRPPPSPTTGPRFRTAIHYRSWADRELKRKLHDSHLRLVDTFEAIGQKYGSVPLEEDDEIDIFTGQITRDRGRLRSLEARPFAEGFQFFDEAVEDDGEQQMRWHSEPVAGPESVVFGDDEDELGDWDERSGLDPQMPPEEVEQPWTNEDLDDLNSFLRAEAASRERSASRSLERGALDATRRTSTSVAAHPISFPSARLQDLFLDDTEDDVWSPSSGGDDLEWEDDTPSSPIGSSYERGSSSAHARGPQRASSSTGLGRPTPAHTSSRSLPSSHSMPDIRSALRNPTKRFPADRYVSQQGASRQRPSTGPRVRWSDRVTALPPAQLSSSPLSAKAMGKQRMRGERPSDIYTTTSMAARPVRRTAERVKPTDLEADIRPPARDRLPRPTPAPPVLRILNEQAWWKRRSESPVVKASVSSAPPARTLKKPVSRPKRADQPMRSDQVPKPASRQLTRSPSIVVIGAEAPPPTAIAAVSKRPHSLPQTVRSKSLPRPAPDATGSQRQESSRLIAVNRPSEAARVPARRTLATELNIAPPEALSASRPGPPLRPSTVAKAQASASLREELEERRSQRRRSASVSSKPTTPRVTARMKREQSVAALTPPTSTRPSELSDHFRDLHVLSKGGVVKCLACKTAGGVRAEWAGYCRGRSRPKLCAYRDELDLLAGSSLSASPISSPQPIAQEAASPNVEEDVFLDDSGYEFDMYEEPSPSRSSSTELPAPRLSPSSVISPAASVVVESETQAIGSSSGSDSEDDLYQPSETESADTADSDWEDIQDAEEMDLALQFANYSLPPQGDEYEKVLLYNGKHDFLRCATCSSADGERAAQAMWCKGRDQTVPCPFHAKSSRSSSRRAKSLGAQPSKTDTWIQEQGDLFAPPKSRPVVTEVETDMEAGPMSSQPSSPVSSTSARATSAGPSSHSRLSYRERDHTSPPHITSSRLPQRAKTALPTPPRSKSISTDVEPWTEPRRAATVAAPASRPTPPPSQTPEPSAAQAKNKMRWWKPRSPEPHPSSDPVAAPSSTGGYSDSDVPSSEPPEPFPEELLTRASDLGINLGPAPSGRISNSLLSALAPSPRRVEPLSASISSSSAFRLTSPPPRSPVTFPSRSERTGLASRSEPNRRASTAGLMLPPPIPPRRTLPEPSASPPTPRKRALRDPDEEVDLPSPSPQKRGRTPNTAPAAVRRSTVPRTPSRSSRASTPLMMDEDDTEFELARVAAGMGDDAGLEWGLDEDAGPEIARGFREGSVVVYA